MGIQLTGIDGPLSGKSKELSAGTYSVGRSPDCDVRVDDPNVSRRHAVIRVRDGAAEIEDTNSRNGTWVNGARVLQSKIGEGDTLKVGDCTFSVSTAREAAPAYVEETPAPPQVVRIQEPEQKIAFAGFWARFAARFIDTLVVTLPYSAFWGLILVVAGRGTPRYFQGMPFWLMALIGFFYIATWLGYLTWMDGTSGQTVGRRATGIWITTQSRSKVTWSDALARHLLHGLLSLVAPSLVGFIAALATAFLTAPNNAFEFGQALGTASVIVGSAASLIYWLFQYILLAADPMKRGWHDKIMGTVVLVKK